MNTGRGRLNQGAPGFCFVFASVVTRTSAVYQTFVEAAEAAVRQANRVLDIALAPSGCDQPVLLHLPKELQSALLRLDQGEQTGVSHKTASSGAICTRRRRRKPTVPALSEMCVELHRFERLPALISKCGGKWRRG